MTSSRKRGQPPGKLERASSGPFLNLTKAPPVESAHLLGSAKQHHEDDPLVEASCTVRARRFDPGAGVVFTHIPKTSGCSLRAALCSAIRAQSTLSGFDRVLFGGFEEFKTLSDRTRSEIYLCPDDMPKGVGLVTGHFSSRMTKIIYPNAQHLTIFREPFTRILSHWLHWRSQNEGALRAWGRWSDRLRLARGSLESFLADPRVACQIDNVSVRMLLWPHSLIPTDGFIDPSADDILIEAAVGELSGFCYYNIAEDPNLVRSLEAWLERPLRYSTLNQTPSMPPGLETDLGRELTPRALELIESRSRLDLRLWILAAQQRHGGVGARTLRDRALFCGSARYSRLALGETKDASSFLGLSLAADRVRRVAGLLRRTWSRVSAGSPQLTHGILDRAHRLKAGV
jgi:hypothetical protein